jgi:hypothetical protein
LQLRKERFLSGIEVSMVPDKISEVQLVKVWQSQSLDKDGLTTKDSGDGDSEQYTG